MVNANALPRDQRGDALVRGSDGNGDGGGTVVLDMVSRGPELIALRRSRLVRVGLQLLAQ